MDRSIVRAIRNHCLLRVDYGGFSRIVEPHIYGQDSQGHELLSVYQVSGGSRSGEVIGWKCFDMAKAGAVVTLPVHFAKPQADYNPGDKTFSKVYSCV